MRAFKSKRREDPRPFTVTHTHASTPVWTAHESPGKDNEVNAHSPKVHVIVHMMVASWQKPFTLWWTGNRKQEEGTGDQV